MTKLSLDALKQRAEAIASEGLLMTISGGTENACHDSYEYQGPDPDTMKEAEVKIDNTKVK